MESAVAVEGLAALAQESRLAIFRRLVQCGPKGLPAGEIATELAIAKPTLSFHLAHLERARLIRSHRQGRSILYAADYSTIAELVGFLYDNCCGSGTTCLPPRRDP